MKYSAIKEMKTSSMNEPKKYYAEWQKKPDTSDHIVYDSICMKWTE